MRPDGDAVPGHPPPATYMAAALAGRLPSPTSAPPARGCQWLGCKENGPCLVSLKVGTVTRLCLDHLRHLQGLVEPPGGAW